jgi:hypothetical protein
MDVPDEYVKPPSTVVDDVVAKLKLVVGLQNATSEEFEACAFKDAIAGRVLVDVHDVQEPSKVCLYQNHQICTNPPPPSLLLNRLC